MDDVGRRVLASLPSRCAMQAGLSMTKQPVHEMPLDSGCTHTTWLLVPGSLVS